MKPVLIAIAMLACAVQPALAQTNNPPAQRSDAPDPVIQYSDQDAAMNAAIADARRTLPQFLAEFDAAPASQRSAFSVKVGLPAEGGGAEHIWVSDLRREGGQLVGALANEPQMLPGMRRGSRVVIDEALISDWSINAREGLYGAYTTRVMLPQLDADTAAQLREMLSPAPTPAWWTS